MTRFGSAHAARILLSAWSVATYLRRWRADLLHCHLPLAGVLGRLAGRLAEVPVVYSEHNRMERYHPLTRWLNVATWRLQRCVFAVSNDVAASIRTHVDRAVPVHVVLNGVDIDHFSAAAIDPRPVRARFGIPQGAQVVGTVAVFRPQKALHHWLDAARRLHVGRPDLRFLIVGFGPLESQLRRLTRQYALDDVVCFAGSQADVRPFLAAMDVFMMSSDVEGLPVALLEAMAMRCASVATPAGGVTEVIDHGQTGMLAPRGRPDLLADAAHEVLSSRTLRHRLADAGRDRIVASFSVRRMAAELEGWYEAVLSGGAGARKA